MQAQFQFILHEPNFNKQLCHEKPTLSTQLHPTPPNNQLHKKKGGEKKKKLNLSTLETTKTPFHIIKKKTLPPKKQPFGDRKNSILDHSPSLLKFSPITLSHLTSPISFNFRKKILFGQNQ
jgi:hypothetical protein